MRFPGSVFRCLDLLIGKSHPPPPLNSCTGRLGEKEAPTSLGWCLGWGEEGSTPGHCHGFSHPPPLSQHPETGFPWAKLWDLPKSVPSCAPPHPCAPSLPEKGYFLYKNPLVGGGGAPISANLGVWDSGDQALKPSNFFLKTAEPRTRLDHMTLSPTSTVY